MESMGDYRPGLPVSLTDKGTKQRDGREKHHEDDGDIKDQFLYSPARFKGRDGVRCAKSAAQAGAAHLEKNKEDDSTRQNNLDNANCRKPLCQNFPRFHHGQRRTRLWVQRQL